MLPLLVLCCPDVRPQLWDVASLAGMTHAAVLSPLCGHTHIFITVLLLTSDFKVPKCVELTTTVITTYS
ncbi:hypothetical protein AB205_0026950 [Aquarana catesbeiana]|uniref:Uncharacterized protein n=1 Tax=Aquarana catesbeiana TaxID=8400 RepID=A0A2G9RQL8_AQUCT|nr:hypothetical protein AB205_0026950 [Aquarana catesbeiana]